MTTPAPPTEPSERYINRELSWLEFNSRVLELAEDDSLPLLERAKFHAIFAENLDEFFQVRVAGLMDQKAAQLGKTSIDGLTPAQQLDTIDAAVTELVERQHRSFVEDLVPALADVGIRLTAYAELDASDRAELDAIFERQIFPVLTPLAVDPGHPFPYISNLSLNLAVQVRDPSTGIRRFARVKVPPLLPRFIVLSDGERFLALEEVIAAHLVRLFPGMEIECRYPFRVTRNADLTVEEDEADDLLLAVEMELRRRRFGRAVRLEIDAGMSDEVRDLLVRELELDSGDVYPISGPLDLTGLWNVSSLDRTELKAEPWTPVTPAPLNHGDEEAVDFFAVLRERDILVHHPYESFSATVEAFIRQAAADPKVLAIKQTLYRTSGDSPIVKSLIRAAERGKQVAVLVEVKARFDEQQNITWARALEQAGVHVVYGLVGLKTHCKAALVVREEEDGVRRYVHVGTGNYNPKTARMYEDVGLLTAEPDLGADLTDLFNSLTGYGRQSEYRRIVVAPTSLRSRLIELIRAEAEAGTDGRIVMKMNGIDDRRLIDELYLASQAGCQIDLIVRGICCLRPGVPGLSENIRVRSIVGRFLEHSRLFAFGNGVARPTSYWMASADLRARNLDRRVEVVVEVEEEPLQARLQEILDVNLADDCFSWTLGPDAIWTRSVPEKQLAAHRRFIELAAARSHANPQSPLVDADAEDSSV
ncbi:MAG: RNA degradosome polyphosphate kinase [Acidimicrobiia bacterium]